MRTLICRTLLMAGLALAPLPTVAEEDGLDPRSLLGAPAVCSNSSDVELQACGLAAESGYLLAAGACLNVADRAASAACFDDAASARSEAETLCGEQAAERLSVCAMLGEAPFDPIYTPAQFVDPDAIGVTVDPNPYFPLIEGLRWVYEANLTSPEGEPVHERIVFTITDRTKVIDGVTVRVVNDQVFRDGLVHEDTDDWFVQDHDGNVWYFGESVKNYTVSDGVAELTDLDGSWTAGIDGGRAGIIMLARPQPGDVYRQEFAVGGPQDLGQVVSITASETVPAAKCEGTCVMTNDWTPLEPGQVAQKYYSPGIGSILEVEPGRGRVELVEFFKP